jgi:acyl-[acyl carrier protein]--UDP-N-acetylglucosamine O-acyltransferase
VCSGVSVLCLITDGFVVSINVTLAGHYNVGHCLFLPHLEDKFMCRLFCKI